MNATDPTDPSDDWVVLERTFDAPVDVLWQMWTDPEHFAAWYGPDGCTIPVAELDVRVGGTRRVCMEMPTPSGPMRMWFSGEYVDVVENERLVYTEAHSDQHGAPPPAPDHDASGAPSVTEVRIEFEDLGGDRTRIVLTHVGVPADSPGGAGWAAALGKLAALVAADSG